MHYNCAICLPSLSFFGHMHSIYHVHYALNMNHICDICDKVVLGLYYNCQGCDFDVHLACTFQYIKSKLHPQDSLRVKLPPSTPKFCMCTSWHYMLEYIDMV